MSENLDFILIMTFFWVFIATVIAAPFAIGPIQYHFNQSTCSVWVDDRMVYNGKCHYVDVEPVGEYGNSKRVAIYNDKRKWHQQQKYISENVQIKEFVE